MVCLFAAGVISVLSASGQTGMEGLASSGKMGMAYSETGRHTLAVPGDEAKSTGELLQKREVFAYPNPTRSNTRIFLDGVSNGGMTVEVTDMDGKVRGTYFYPAGCYGLDVYVRQLPAGKYVLHIYGDNFKRQDLAVTRL